jgi:HAD superfamily hydrolase (TIGR01509 family)
MLEAILFDHDGTLVDSEKIHYRLLSDVLSKYGITMSFDEYQYEYEGVPLPETAKKLVLDFSLDVAPEEIVAQKKQATKSFLANNAFPLIDGARDTIIHYHSMGLKLAIVTGATRTEGVLNTIDRYELGQYISAVITSDDVMHSKPAPDCYLHAMEKLGVKPEHCVAFEDSITGCMSALAAGVPCVGVSSRVSQDDFFQGKTIGSFINLAEANAWLRQRINDD